MPESLIDDDDSRFEAAQVEFGARVREARQAKGESLETLAAGSAMHWTYVARVERGQGNVTLRSLLRLAIALDTDPATLVAGLNTAGK